MNVVHRLHNIADGYPDKTALVSDDGELTYSELIDEIDRYAAGLQEIGVGTGDRYTLVSNNSNRMLALLMAGWKIGAIPAPINPRLEGETIELMIADTGARIVFVDGPTTERALEVDGNETTDSNRTVIFSRELEASLPTDPSNSPSSSEPSVVPRLDSDDALFLHTAGTTGHPKWVRLTHGNLASSLAVMPAAGLDSTEMGLHYFPLYHSGGIDMTLCRLLRGATVVLGNSWDPEDALEKIERYEVDGVTLVPQMGYELVTHDAVGDYDLASLSYFLVGSDTVSEEVATAFRDLGAQPMQAYGLTETMAVIAVTTFGDTACPLDSTGKVVGDAATVKIVDPDTGDEVDTGEIGEIVIAGDKVAPGYHERPEQESAAFENGWLHTDDLGKFDDDGYLHITGRLTNMLIVGGENVYPTDVEETLERHPDVSRAVVVGVPDERKGQIPVANVILTEDSGLGVEDLKQWFIAQSAAFKHPREIRILEELPTTPLGKIDRTKLQKEVRSELSSRD